MADEKVLLNNGMINSFFALPGQYQNSQFTELSETSDNDYFGVSSFVGDVSSDPLIWNPSEKLGGKSEINETTLDMLLYPSGNLMKDTYLLFSLLKTVPDLKAAWKSYSFEDRQAIIKTFRTAIANSAEAWDEDRYYELVTPEDYAYIDDGFYAELGISIATPSEIEDVGPLPEESFNDQDAGSYSATLTDVVEPADVIDSSDSLSPTDAYDEPAAFVTKEPPWAAISEAVAVVQGKNGEDNIGKYLYKKVVEIDDLLSADALSEFPEAIETSLIQMSVVGAALHGRAGGEYADIGGEYVSAKDYLRSLAKYNGNWAGSVSDIESFIMTTEEVLLANAVDSKINMFDDWIAAMGEHTPETVVELRQEYKNLRNILDTNHGKNISSSLVKIVSSAYDDLGKGELLKQVLLDVAKVKQYAEEQKEKNLLKGIAFVGIMIGSIAAAEFTGGYSFSWMIDAGVSMRWATVGSFLISTATMVGVQEIGSQKLLDAPSKDFLGYLEEYGWMILAMGVIKAPQLAKGIWSGKGIFGLARSAPLLGGEMAAAGTKMLPDIAAGEWLSPAMMKHLGWSYVALTGIEAMREVAHGEDPLNALSPESMGSRFLFLGSVALVGHLMQPWRQNLVNNSLNKIWRGYQADLMMQDVEIAKAANELKLLSAKPNEVNADYNAMYQLYSNLFAAAEARYKTFGEIENNFGKGSVAADLMTKAEKNVALAKAGLAEAKVWQDLLGEGNKGGIKREYDGWIYNDGPSTEEALSALIKHYAAKGYNMSLSVEEDGITLWYASADGKQVDFVTFNRGGKIDISGPKMNAFSSKAAPDKIWGGAEDSTNSTVSTSDTSLLHTWRVPWLLTEDPEIMGHLFLKRDLFYSTVIYYNRFGNAAFGEVLTGNSIGNALKNMSALFGDNKRSDNNADAGKDGIGINIGGQMQNIAPGQAESDNAEFLGPMRKERIFSKDGFYEFVVKSNAITHQEAIAIGTKILQEWIYGKNTASAVKILDLACGSMPITICQIMAQFANHQFEYTGVDINPDQVNALNNNFRFPVNVSNVKVVQGNAWDLQELPIKEEYQVIFSGLNFHHGKPNELYFVAKQLHHILADDGMVINHDIYRPNDIDYLERPDDSKDGREDYSMVPADSLDAIIIPRFSFTVNRENQSSNDWRSDFVNLLNVHLVDLGADPLGIADNSAHILARDYPVSVSEMIEILTSAGFRDVKVYDLMHTNHPVKKYFAVVVARK